MDRFKDSAGNEIFSGDLIKMFHFTGARGKRHFMYKKAGNFYITKGVPYLNMYHYTSTQEHRDFSMHDNQYEMVVVERAKFKGDKTDNLKDYRFCPRQCLEKPKGE